MAPTSFGSSWPPIHMYFDYELPLRYSGLTPSDDSLDGELEAYEYFTLIKVDSSLERSATLVYESLLDMEANRPVQMQIIDFGRPRFLEVQATKLADGSHRYHCSNYRF